MISEIRQPMQTPPLEVVAVPRWIMVGIFGAFLSGAGVAALAAIGMYVQQETAAADAASREEKRVAVEALREENAALRESHLNTAVSELKAELKALRTALALLTQDRITKAEAEGEFAEIRAENVARMREIRQEIKSMEARLIDKIKSR